MLHAIVWDIDPELINLFGVFSIRYYSLFFVGGLVLGYVVVKNIYKREGLPIDDIDTLATYIFIATVVGARLGHCLFYEPDYYLSHPLEMILPFRFGEDGFEMTGYRGLASHGGILGVFIAIWLYCRRTKTPFLAVLDRVAIGGALAAVFIRLANFMNSEIIGNPTGTDYGVIFKQVDMLPRHPAQLYESFAYLLIFVLIYFVYKKRGKGYQDGFNFGLFFTLLFVARFVIEFFKKNQVAFEEGMMFNMGQLLSVPFMLAGIGVMIWKWPGRGRPKTED